MKIQIVGKADPAFADQVRGFGFDVVATGGDVVLAYGGDGTFIGSERKYPGIPKVPIRDARSCIKCPEHRDERVLERLRRGELVETRLDKLEAQWRELRLSALNDVILRNADPRAAVRFRLHLNGQIVTEELIADGVVVCTPFGSSAYFRSITRTVIRCGFGVAINNCTELPHHLVIGSDERLEIELTRGPAEVVVDNDPEAWSLASGDRLSIIRSADTACVFNVETLRCPDCRYAHAPRRRY